MAAHASYPKSGAVEVHHAVPRHLLSAWDRGHGRLEQAADLQDWIEWTEEAYRYGVDPDVTRADLAVMVEASTVVLPREQHREGHKAAGDFARWGRRGGLATLALYGADWFRLLAKRRWETISTEQLSTALTELGPPTGVRC